ncbi:hypothetical protein FKM82_031113 [Ascaphus truei]
MCGEHDGFACQSAYKQSKATSTVKEIGNANQNGGSRFPGRPRGPSAENSANAKVADSWPGLAPKREPHPVGGSGAKAVAAPSRTVTGSEPVLGHPVNLWDSPQIFTRGRGLYLCQARPELSEGGAGCELPVPQLRGAGEQERPLCKLSPFDSSDEEKATPTTVVMRLPADHDSSAAKEPALSCVAEERSLEVPRLPVRKQPKRRSPTAVLTYSTEGEDTIPSRWRGKRFPCPPQAPVVAMVERGLAQARAERRAEPLLLAADVVLEEEVPVGNPTQDGGESREIHDIISGGHSGTGWNKDRVNRSASPMVPGKVVRSCGS